MNKTTTPLYSVGKKYPHITNGYLKIMAYADGYYMARFKGCYPFVATESEITKRLIQ
jgi:hypothetical protein